MAVSPSPFTVAVAYLYTSPCNESLCEFTLLELLRVHSASCQSDQSIHAVLQMERDEEMAMGQIATQLTVSLSTTASDHLNRAVCHLALSSSNGLL